MFRRSLSGEKCSVPKTANGVAKHTGARAATLSIPRACAISLIAAHRPITSTARPTRDIARTVPGNSRNTARSFGCFQFYAKCARDVQIQNPRPAVLSTFSRRCGSRLVLQHAAERPVRLAYFLGVDHRYCRDVHDVVYFRAAL